MTKKNITIIDADSIVYIIAYSFKDDKITKLSSVRIAEKVDTFVKRILINTKADEYLGYLGKPGGKKCFRYERAETVAYKHTRKPKEDWFILYQPLILKRLQEEWKFEAVEGYEADDYVCQAAAKFRDKDYPVTIAAIDKDIRQVTGVTHYTYNPSGLSSKELETLPDSASYFQLYSLMLTGDTSDGYSGIPGVGAKKTMEILDKCITEKEFETATKKAYKYWFTEGLLEKEIKKTLKDHYDMWKINNPNQRLTKAIKETDIHADLEEIFEAQRKYSKDFKNLTWKTRYDEMYDLAKLPDTGNFHEDIIISETIHNKFKAKTKFTRTTSDMKSLLDNIT